MAGERSFLYMLVMWKKTVFFQQRHFLYFFWLEILFRILNFSCQFFIGVQFGVKLYFDPRSLLLCCFVSSVNSFFTISSLLFFFQLSFDIFFILHFQITKLIYSRTFCSKKNPNNNFIFLLNRSFAKTHSSLKRRQSIGVFVHISRNKQKL